MIPISAWVYANPSISHRLFTEGEYALTDYSYPGEQP